MDPSLLSPTLQDAPARTGAKPWRLTSQLWVAFFGGTLAYAIIGTLNALRLGCSRTVRQVTFAVCGSFILIDLAARVTLAKNWVELDLEPRSVRLAMRLVALLLYVIVRWLQRSADRVYDQDGDDDYASLWGPGLAATAVALAVTFLVVKVARTM